MADYTDVYSFTDKEKKAVIEKIKTLQKQHGMSLRGLAKAAGVATGGLEKLSKGTDITPNMATKCAKAFGYNTWYDMINNTPVDQPTESDWKKSMDVRVVNLEKELFELRNQLQKLISAQSH